MLFISRRTCVIYNSTENIIVRNRFNSEYTYVQCFSFVFQCLDNIGLISYTFCRCSSTNSIKLIVCICIKYLRVYVIVLQLTHNVNKLTHPKRKFSTFGWSSQKEADKSIFGSSKSIN